MMTMVEAEAVAKKMYKLEQKRRDTVELFEGAMERIKVELYDLTEQQKVALAPIDEDILYYKQQLEAFSRQQLEETGEKTIRLPHATLTARKQPQDYHRDEEVLLQWVQDNAAEFVKLAKPSVAWGDLKKQLVVAGDKVLLKDTGEVIDGLEPKPIEVKFDVEVVG